MTQRELNLQYDIERFLGLQVAECRELNPVYHDEAFFQSLKEKYFKCEWLNAMEAIIRSI